MRQAIASALQAFAVFLFVVAAGFLLALPYVPKLRFILSDALLNRPEALTQAGLGLLGLSLLFLIGFYAGSRGYYLVIRMGKHTLAVDEKILLHTVSAELEKKFASKLQLQQVDIVRGRHIAFGMKLEPMGDEESDQILSQTEEHVGTLLRERFGYRRPFTVKILTS